jgi:hypothetical protein
MVKNKNTIQNTLIIMILLVSSLIFFFVSYTSFGSYDRFGNRYSEYTKVLYYSENGQTYKMIPGEYYGDTYYVNFNNPNERHVDTVSYISQDGYIFFDDAGTTVKSANKNNVAIYIDGNGEECYEAHYITWNWTGGISGVTPPLLSSPYEGTQLMSILINVCPAMLLLVIVYNAYLIYLKKYTSRTIVLRMFYSLPPIAVLGIASMSNWEGSAIVGGVIYIVCIYAIKKTFIQIEEYEQKGATAFLTKDIKPQESAFTKMTEDEKANYYASIKKQKVNVWVFTALFWGVPIVGMILVQVLTGQKYYIL